MLVEMLERRGMLSVSIGSLADDAGDDAGAPADAAAETSTEFVGLPSGFSLLVASPMAWQEFGTGQIAPTREWNRVDEPEISGPFFSGAIEVAELLGDTGFSDSAFGLSTTTDLTLGATEDSVSPPDFELAPEGTHDGGGDPVIIVDPIVIDPPTVDLDESMEPPAPPDTEAPPLDAEGNDEDPLVVVDPVVVDPVDVRVKFVSSDPGWAAYYYHVGPDGDVEGVFVIASYHEPTIAAFVAEHRDDAGVQVSDGGDCLAVSGFPLELAPPCPERADLWAWSTNFSDGVMVSEPLADNVERTYVERTHVDTMPVVIFDRPLSVGAMPAPAPAAESGEDLDNASAVVELASDEEPSRRVFSVRVAEDSSEARTADRGTASRNGGDFAAAAAWLNSTSGGEPDTARLPGGKRRTR